MKISGADQALRAALDLTLDAFDHRDEVLRLATKHSRAIVYLSMHHAETCAPYALRLTDDPTYEFVRHVHREVFAGPTFMAWLLQGHLVEIQSPRPDCLVSYFSAEVWKHVGVMIAADRVKIEMGCDAAI